MGGRFFLDEVGDMPLAMQVKPLLRVFAGTKKSGPSARHHEIDVDVRVIARNQ